MFGKKAILIPIIAGIVLIIVRQAVLNIILAKDFSSTEFILSSIYIAIMVAIPITFVRKNQLKKTVSTLSISQTVGLSLLIFFVYIVLFFSRLIIMIDLFAQKPMYLVVEFLMMVFILAALSLPFMRRLKDVDLAQRS